MGGTSQEYSSSGGGGSIGVVDQLFRRSFNNYVPRTY